jgi:hypothetical protein
MEYEYPHARFVNNKNINANTNMNKTPASLDDFLYREHHGNNGRRSPQSKLNAISSAYKKKQFGMKWLVPLIGAAAFGISAVGLAKSGYLPKSMSISSLRGIDAAYDVKLGLVPSTVKLIVKIFGKAATIAGKSVSTFARALFGAAWATTPIFRYIFGAVFFNVRSKVVPPS